MSNEQKAQWDGTHTVRLGGGAYDVEVVIPPVQAGGDVATTIEGDVQVQNQSREKKEIRDEKNRSNAERCLGMQREYEAEVAKTEERLNRLYPEDIDQLGAVDREKYGLDSENPQIQSDGRALYSRARETQLRHLTEYRNLVSQYGEFAQRYNQDAQRNETSWNRKWDE